MRRFSTSSLWILLVVATTVPAEGAQQLPRSQCRRRRRRRRRAAQSPNDPAYFYLLAGTSKVSVKINEALAALQAGDCARSRARAELAVGARRRSTRARASRPTRSHEAEAALAHDPANIDANRIIGDASTPISAEQKPASPPRRRYVDVSGPRDCGVREGARRRIRPGLELLSSRRLYLQTGAFDKAVPLLRRVVESQPGLDRRRRAAARRRRESAGSTDEAVETLEALLQQNPGSIAHRFASRRFAKQQEQWSAAADAYGKAQTLNPRAPLIDAPRGGAPLEPAAPARRGRVDRAALAAGGPEGNGSSPAVSARRESARARRISTRRRRRRRSCSHAIPDDVPRPSRAVADPAGPGRPERRPKRTLRRSIARDPLDANALNSLGYMFAERGDQLEEAVRAVAARAEGRARQPSYLDSLGWAYFQQGRLNLADRT